MLLKLQSLLACLWPGLHFFVQEGLFRCLLFGGRLLQHRVGLGFGTWAQLRVPRLGCFGRIDQLNVVDHWVGLSL